MDVTTPTNVSPGSAATKSPESEVNGSNEHLNHATKPEPHLSGSMAAPAAAAPAVHQPKIVQTAFIHKLYK
jgi:hypothetical protein